MYELCVIKIFSGFTTSARAAGNTRKGAGSRTDGRGRGTLQKTDTDAGRWEESSGKGTESNDGDSLFLSFLSDVTLYITAFLVYHLLLRNGAYTQSCSKFKNGNISVLRLKNLSHIVCIEKVHDYGYAEQKTALYSGGIGNVQ